MVARVLKEIPHIVEVYPIKYGYFDAFRFWCPLFTRKGPIDFVYRQIEIVRGLHPGVRLSVVAHSFGTHIISQILAAHPDMKFHRLVLCGSVIPNAYRWDLVKHRFSTRVINDYGTRDVWPILAKSLSWGYGDTGSNGFGVPDVRDRAHDYSHSDFFNEAFVRDYWRPWFFSSVIVPSIWDERVPPKPFWWNLYGLLPMQLILLLLLSLGIVFSARFWLHQQWLAGRVTVYGVDTIADDQPIDREIAISFSPGAGFPDKKGSELNLSRSELSHMEKAICNGFAEVHHFPEPIQGVLTIPFTRSGFDEYYPAIAPSEESMRRLNLPEKDKIDAATKKNTQDRVNVNLIVHNRTDEYLDVLLSPHPPPKSPITDGNRTWSQVTDRPIVRNGFSEGEYTDFAPDVGYFLIAVSRNCQEAQVIHHDALLIASWVVLEIKTKSPDRQLTCEVIGSNVDPRIPSEKEKP